MTSILTPARPHAPDHPPLGRRLGYLVAISVNAFLWWMAHQLLEWEWPGFLTPAFDDVLPLVSLSFAATIVANVGYLWRDRGSFRAAAELCTSTVALLVSVRMWDVFPFDFSGYDHDWTWLFRTALVIAIVGSAVAMVVNAAKLARTPADSR